VNNPSKKKSGQTVTKPTSIGDTICFIRKNLPIKGTVQQVKDNLVIVEVSLEDAAYLKIDNQYTVVAHRNYEVLKPCGMSK
jgi:uncharacterized protein YkvS